MPRGQRRAQIQGERREPELLPARADSATSGKVTATTSVPSCAGTGTFKDLNGRQHRRSSRGERPGSPPRELSRAGSERSAPRAGELGEKTALAALRSVNARPLPTPHPPSTPQPIIANDIPVAFLPRVRLANGTEPGLRGERGLATLPGHPGWGRQGAQHLVSREITFLFRSGSSIIPIHVAKLVEIHLTHLT